MINAKKISQDLADCRRTDASKFSILLLRWRMLYRLAVRTDSLFPLFESIVFGRVSSCSTSTTICSGRGTSRFSLCWRRRTSSSCGDIKNDKVSPRRLFSRRSSSSWISFSLICPPKVLIYCFCHTYPKPRLHVTRQIRTALSAGPKRTVDFPILRFIFPLINSSAQLV